VRGRAASAPLPVSKDAPPAWITVKLASIRALPAEQVRVW
jgi:hypothetical protein